MNWLPIAAILGVFFFLAAGGAYAAMPQPPVHRLRISFNIAEARVIGSSTIEIPANSAAEIYIDELDITSISMDGQALPLSPDQKILEIAAEPAPRVMAIDYSKKIPASKTGNGSIISENGITLTGLWYPALSENAFFELTATVPADFDAVSEADSIETTMTAAGRELRFLFPRSLASLTFIAGPYEVQKKQLGPDREVYTYFFAEDRELAAGYLEKAIAYLERYEKLIGPYPYRRFSVVENRLPSGFAVPTMTLLGQTVVCLPFIADTSLCHEALHIWFGNNVGMNRNSGNWAEGLTTYLADQLLAADTGKDAEFRKNELIKYRSYVNDRNAVSLKSFVSAAGNSADREASRAVVYGKSSMIFHMLHNKLGNDTFYRAIQDFYQRLSGKEAGWEDLIQSFETISGQNLDEFFGQWLERKDIPHLEAKNIRAEERNGQAFLSFSLIQHNEKPFALTVPFKVLTLQDEVQATVDVSGLETPVEVPLPATPLELAIDPNYDLMRRLDLDETPPVWSAFLGSANTLTVLAPGPASQTFAPLLPFLNGLETLVADPTEISDCEIAENSVLFLDATIPAARALFAEPPHPKSGFTIDIRRNPLNREHLAILTSASNPDEVAAVIGKLPHYGKYSYLHFEQGRLLEKGTTETGQGQVYTVNSPPVGIETQQSLTFKDIMGQLADKRVVYVGEEHTRFEDHRLQLDVIRALHGRNPKLAIGMEMFYRTDQAILDDFIAGKLEEKDFLDRIKYFEKWGYDYRNYREIIDFARLNRIPVIALNLNKEIVGKVYKENGMDALNAEERQAIPGSRDLDLPGYQARISEVYETHRQDQKEPDRFKSFLQAQALWDETMAETVADYLTAHPEERMVVVAGQGHVVKKDAMPPRVARRLAVDQAIVVNAANNATDATLADFIVFLNPVELPAPALLGVMLKEDKGVVMVEKISVHGGAGKAGILENDIILALDSQAVTSINDIKLVMFYKKKGEKVKVLLKRPRTILPDKELEIEVAL